MDCTRSLPPAAVAPAAVAAVSVSASEENTATDTGFPVPWGRGMDPRMDCPGLRGSRFKFRISSIVSS